MAAVGHLFKYERFGFSFTVYANHIDVVPRGFLGAPQTDTLLIKSIASVSTALGGKLQITLTDGSVRAYGLGRRADGARVTILTLI